MSAALSPRQAVAAERRRDTAPNATPPASSPASASKARYVWALTRISLGWVFLWAFLDKAFGLGYATERADAWVNGGSPTVGFLTFGTNGPFAGAFQSIAGAAWADWLFMVGLAGIGVALVLGIGTRIAAVSGALMLVLMYAAAPVLENNPFMDDHLVYALVLIGLAQVGAGRTWGLGRRWEATDLVRRYPALR